VGESSEELFSMGQRSSWPFPFQECHVQPHHTLKVPRKEPGEGLGAERVRSEEVKFSCYTRLERSQT